MEVKADLHIHTTLSPCGDIEMSPRNIVKKALERGLGIIAITDHNSTLQAPIIEKLGSERGLWFFAEQRSQPKRRCTL